MGRGSASMSKARKDHLKKRLLFFLLGMVLFVAPFSLLLVGIGQLCAALDSGIGGAAINSEPTVHRAMCLRMPLTWAVFSPERFFGRIIGNPLYLLIFLLIGISFFVGPLFCGWLCPGGMPEHLSRIVPSRFKINLRGKLDPVPIRYGFLAGFFIVAAPFIKKSVCCAYCNWTWIENVWNGLFGNLDGITGYGMFAFTSSSIITFLLTFVVLGVVLEGGRGWCNFLCPAGALQNLTHWIGARLPFTYKIKHDMAKCRCSGEFCVESCPTWAVRSEDRISIDRHICNGCMDCISACPNKAITYEKGK